MTDQASPTSSGKDTYLRDADIPDKEWYPVLAAAEANGTTVDDVVRAALERHVADNGAPGRAMTSSKPGPSREHDANSDLAPADEVQPDPYSEAALWAEHAMEVRKDSPTALRGPAAAEFGRKLIENASEPGEAPQGTAGGA